MTGKTPLQIFIEAGINVNLIGREQPERCLSRWRKVHNKYNGLLQENRGIGSSGRPRKIPLTTEEQLAKLQRENEILVNRSSSDSADMKRIVENEVDFVNNFRIEQLF